MERNPSLLLFDVKRSVEAILNFTIGLSLESYSGSELVRSAVERRFEILGEALARLRRADPVLAARVPDLHRAIAFRNILIHGYDAVDDTIVWRTIEGNLPLLLSEVDALIAERDPS